MLEALKNKAILIGLTVLISAIIILLILWLKTVRDLELKAVEVAKEKIEFFEQEKVKKEILLDSLKSEFSKKIEQISNQEQKIKYVPYEKTKYIDRDVDAALDSISKYRYDTGANSEKK